MEIRCDGLSEAAVSGIVGLCLVVVGRCSGCEMAGADLASIDWVKRAIQKVLDGLNWKYLAEEDVGAREVVCIFGAGDLGNWVLINRILAPKGVLLIMATCQENVPIGQRQAAVEFVTRANFGILNGFFDMDLTDGDLRFSSRVEYGLLNDPAQFETNFRQTFQIVHGTFSKYLPGVVGVTKKGMSGRQAVELIEGGANMLPNATQTPLLATVARHLSASSTNYVSHPEKGVIRMPCTVQGVTYHLRIKAMEETQHLYVFCNYPRSAGKVPSSAVSAMSEYVCRANWALPFGYFDMDVQDGELRFVAWLPTSGIPALVVQTQFVRALIVSAITTFVKYLPGMDALVSGEQTRPEQAIKAVEAEPARDLRSESVARIIESGLASSDDEEQDGNAKFVLNLSKSPNENDDDDDEQQSAASSIDRPNRSETSKQRSQVKVVYNDDGSGVGALEFIANKGGSVVWTNPFESGQILLSSSPATATGDIGDLVGRNPTKLFITAASEQPWISVDLRHCSLTPSHYSLGHSSVIDTDALRSWRFQASNDSRHWVTLDEKIGDGSLSSRTPKRNWPISSPKASYCKFRVVMTGPNANHSMQLALGHLELFGQLTVDFPVEPHLVDLRAEEGARRLEIASEEIQCDWGKSLHLGSGVHGDVFRGVCNGVAVAVKRISYRHLGKDQIRNGYKSLVDYITMMTMNDDLVRVVGLCDDIGQSAWLLVTEWVPTSSSSPILPTTTSLTSRLLISLQVARAIAALHQRGLAHGSLHLGNTLLTHDYANISISDAGLAQALPPILTGRPVGVHLGFCAPELFLQTVNVDKLAADLYSLAMIIFVMVTGRLPYDDLSDVAASTLVSKIALGHRPTLPDSLPDAVIVLLTSLWDANACNRPDAASVVQTLQKLTTR